MRMDSKKKGQCDYCQIPFIGKHLCDTYKAERIKSFKAIAERMVGFVDRHVTVMEDFETIVGSTKMTIKFSSTKEIDDEHATENA